MLLGSYLEHPLLQPRPPSVVKINAMIHLHLHKIFESFDGFLVVGLVAVLTPVYLAGGCLHLLLDPPAEA